MPKTKPAPHQARSSADQTPGGAERPSGEPNLRPAGGSPPPSPPRDAVRARRAHQRQAWRWNGSLLIFTGVVLALLMIAATGSYYYHSGTAAETFLKRAEMAAEAQDYAGQAKWLRRYSLLNPRDLDAVATAAIASDSAADHAEQPRRFAAINNARKQLSLAIAQVSSGSESQSRELRERLIERLLQLGGLWAREAERQVIMLDREPADPEATEWLAHAVFGQVLADTYQERDPTGINRDDHPWRWLAQQSVGDVLTLAIKRNPQDLELTGALLHLLDNHHDLASSLTDHRERQQHLAQIERALSDAVDRLRDHHDSRAQLIVFQHANYKQQSPAALTGLQSAAEAAADRLIERNAAPQPAPHSPENPGDRPAYYWDFALVLEAANRTAQSDPLRAMAWYEQLMSLELGEEVGNLLETTFVNAGSMQEELGNRQSAIEIWERGLQRVNDRSLELLAPLGYAYLNQQREDEAEATVEQFGEAIDLAQSRLLRASPEEMAPADRVAMGRRLETAAWRHTVMEAAIDARHNKRIEAIKRLHEVLQHASAVEVEDRERAVVARMLADLHVEDGAWDQAGMAFDRALSFRPDHLALRVAAAEAWTRAGNRLKAMEHWSYTQTSDSLTHRLQHAYSKFEYQLRLAPEQRDFSELRAIIEDVRQKLAESAPAANDEELEERQTAEQSLQVLEISIPPVGQLAEVYLHSIDFAQQLAEFAERHPREEIIQAYAAERLAAAGDPEGAAAALQRLRQTAASSTATAVIAARIQAQRGDPESASKQLIDHAVAIAEAEPKQAERTLRLAAEFATAHGDARLAHQALTHIPSDQRSLEVLFLLARVALSLSTSGQPLQVDDATLSPAEAAKHWKQQLRQREGDSGTYWRFLEAVEVIGQLRAHSGHLDQDDPRLRKSRRLVSEILSLRPRWGEAVSLEGWLSAIEGLPEQAVEQLRAGIAIGDQRLQTRQLLVEQLYALSRFSEAEEVLRQTTSATAAAVDKYGFQQIHLAQRQGDFERSLTIAQDVTVQRPDDYLSHLVLASTASRAAEMTPQPAAKRERIALARQAIARAEELATQDQPQVFAARLQLELAHGEDASVEAEIQRLQASSLATYPKLMLESWAHIQRKQYQKALELLEEADAIRSTLQTQSALLTVYRQLGQSDDEIRVLRELYRRHPESDSIRNDLARALAARDNKDVNWNELAQLLASGDNVTPNNRFLYAVLLATKGDERKQRQATELLRQLVDEHSKTSDDARRFLAALLRKRIETLAAEDVDQRDAWDQEIRSLYETLLAHRSSVLSDTYRYASYLLDLDRDAENDRLGQLNRALRTDYPGSLPTLEVAVRYSMRTEDMPQTVALVEAWATDALEKTSMSEVQVATVAGGTLLKIRQFAAAEPWLEKAYSLSPQILRNYITVLLRLDQYQRSIDVCTSHFEKHHDAASASLLVESLLHQGEENLSPRHRMLILDALDRHEDDLTLLESVATLRLQQGDTQQAIGLYERIRNRGVASLRTLNNLAIAYSESGSRAVEGLDLIDQAIDQAGELPELLDSRGIILVATGDLAGAQAAFEAALSQSPEPRYQLHLIFTLLGRGLESQARQQWQTLNLNALKLTALTANDREQLALVKSRFGSPTENPTLESPES